VDVDPGPTAADTELHRSDFQPPGQQSVLTTTNVFLGLLIDHQDAAAENQLPQKRLMPAGVRGVFPKMVSQNCSASARFTAGMSRKAGSKGASEPIMSATLGCTL
jgi:hypothetical protein